MNEFDNAIVACEVHKRYGGAAGNTGLNEFNLEVAAGSVHGLLGPNGAGKTTAIRILSTLLRMDSGRALVGGFDVRTQGRQVRERIGLVGQYAAVDEILSGQQNLEMFGRLNRLPARTARTRASELLERFSLADTGAKPVSAYSGGMRRRLDLAASLIVSPPVLFVDEPTTGLDPMGRHEVWRAIRELAGAGTTVLLTTQYLEEADQLASRIAMLKAGRVVAEGSPDELKARVGGDWLEIALASMADLEAARRVVARVSAGEMRADEASWRLNIPVAERTKGLVQVVAALGEAGIEPLDIVLRRPTLDEAFIHLTGDQVIHQEAA